MAHSHVLKNEYGTPTKVSTTPIIFFCVFIWIGFEGFWVAFMGTSALTFVTHIIILLAFIGFLLESTRRLSYSRCILYFICSITLLVGSSVLGSHSRGPLIALLAVPLYLKIAYIFCLAKKVKIERLATVFRVLAMLHILGVIASFIYYDYFFYLRNGEVVDRWHRILGLQLNPNALAFFSASLALFFIFVKKRMALAIILIGTILWSGSRSALLFFSIAAIYLGAIEGRLRGKLLIIGTLVVMMLGAVMFSQRFVDTLEKTQHAIDGDGLYVRAAMMAGGYRLAVQNFPFGSGGGTFGSPLGTDMVTYRDASIAHLPKVQDGGGIHDSGVGSLLGEYGFFGALIVVVLIAALTRELGCKKLTGTDVMVVVSLVVLLSFFRGIVSSYYYSALIAFFVLMIRHARTTRLLGHA